MTSINDTFVNALLADACYVEGLRDLMAGDELRDLLSNRMTPQLAKFISDNFEVASTIDLSDHVASGFDATAWRGKAGTPYAGKVYVSMRGTEGIQDFLTDIELALTGNAGEQIVDMVNWWLRISTPEGHAAHQFTLKLGGLVFAKAPDVKGTGLITSSELSAGVAVNGHSLGGYLAAAFTRLLGTQAHVLQTSTFNSAGFAPGSEVAFSVLQQLIGPELGRPSFPGAGDASQLNYFARHGLNVTTNSLWFNQVGMRVDLFNENSNMQIPNHYMYKLTDAQALNNVLAQLDPSITLARANEMLERGSKEMISSIEGLLDSLRSLVIREGIEKTPAGDASNSAATRLVFHQYLDALRVAPTFSALAGKVTIEYDFDASTKNTDFAAFASLAVGSTVQLRTQDFAAMDALGQRHVDLYAKWNADIALLLAGEDGRDLNFTDQWAVLRAGFLTDRGRANASDNDFWYSRSGSFATLYDDLTTNATLLVAPGPGGSVPTRYVTFGSSGRDIADGGNSIDHLFGMAGNDSLSGFAGGDWLEGGEGQDTLVGGDAADVLLGGTGADTLDGGKGLDHLRGGRGGGDRYIFSGDWSTDEVVDADGSGRLQVDGFESGLPAASVKVADGVWRSQDGKVMFTRVVNDAGNFDLILSFTGKQGRVVLRDWQSGWFGITLGSTAANPPNTTRSFCGDQRAKIEQNAGEHYHDYLWNQTAWQPDGSLQGGVAEAGFSDVITGLTTADRIEGRSGNDALYGADGNDLIRGEGGNDLLAGGIGKDWIEGGTGDDFVMSGDDLTVARQVNRDDPKWSPPPGHILVTSGDTWGVTDIGVFYSDLNPPRDTASDYVDGGAGNDSLHGAQGADTLIGGVGNDNIYALGGADVVKAGDDNDWAHGDGFNLANAIAYCPPELYGADVLDLGAGNDVGFGDGDNDVLYGGSGNDELWGDGWLQWVAANYHGEDFLDGGAGNDILIGGGKDDVLYGGRNDDTLYGDDFADASTLAGNDDLHGDDGDDQLIGRGGDDKLDGGRGADVLNGGDGNDTLVGGFGVDAYNGGVGDDVYILGPGEAPGGQATPTAPSSLARTPIPMVQLEDGQRAHVFIHASEGAGIRAQGGTESVYDDEGQNSIQVTGTLSSVDSVSDGHLTLLLSDGQGGSTTFELQNAFYGMFQNVNLGGGDLLLRDWVQEHVTQAVSLSTEGAPVPYVFGAAGADFLFGTSTTNDTLDGGAGNDHLFGYTGDDSMIGAEGNDDLNAGNGNDSLMGGDGQDTLWAGEGADVIDGGAGADVIDLGGGDGDDVYLFGYGDGQDVVTRQSWGGTEVNTLRFEAGVTAADVMVRREWGKYVDSNGKEQTGYIHLRITLLSSGESFLADNFSRDDDPFATGNPLQRIEFADGTNWDLTEICRQAAKGSQYDDDLIGFALTPGTVEGFAGNDTLIGTGNDTLLGGDGDDHVLGGENDVADGGNGNDFVQGDDTSTVRGGAGDDQFYGGHVVDGGDGNDWAQGNYNVDFRGGGGNDLLRIDYSTDATASDHAIIRGGQGNDELLGGLFTELRFDRGDGVDRYYGYDNSYMGDADSSQRGSLRLGADIAVGQVKLVLRGDDLVMDLGAGDAVTLARYFADYGSVKRGTEAQISIGDVVFSGGGARDVRSWMVAGGTNAANTLVGSAGDDVIAGYLGNDILDGGLGHDGLHGGAGDDSLTGGDGSDTLAGGYGRDTLVGGVGDDTYYIDDMDVAINEAVGAGIDTVFYDCVKLSPVGEYTLRDNFENLTLNERDGSFSAPGVANGNAVANRIVGNTVNNELRGLAGADTILGGQGDDTLDGGIGVDSMAGGTGDDTYLVDVATDVTEEAASEGEDTVISGITWTLGNEVENLNLTGTATTGEGNGLANSLIGNDVANILEGLDGDDSLDGGLGADAMTGGSGSDSYWVNDASDTTIEAAQGGFDTVVSSLDWQVAAEVENLQLTGSAAIGKGNDIANVLIGNDIANTLQGLGGGDILDGGLGNDRLEGGIGADTYKFATGYGKDTVVEKDATAGVRDRVDFGSLEHDDVTFVHVGDDLEARINGSTDKLVFKSWYLGTKYQVEDFAFADGTWTNTQVAPAANLLIDAMASFGAYARGVDTSAWMRHEPNMGRPIELAMPVMLC